MKITPQRRNANRHTQRGMGLLEGALVEEARVLAGHHPRADGAADVVVHRVADDGRVVDDRLVVHSLRLFAGFYEGEPALVADLYADTLVLHNYAQPAADGADTVRAAVAAPRALSAWVSTVMSWPRFAFPVRFSREAKNHSLTSTGAGTRSRNPSKK